jgi:alcohol dehydrogenase, propanol-preferring
MKAWQFTGTNEPLVLAEVDEPSAGPGEVVVDVRAAGLCHTDVGVLHDEGWLSTLAKRPITMGHEVAGVIVEVDDGVTGWQVGDRVGLCPTTSVGAPGFGFDGGFGEKVALGVDALVPIPDGVSMAQGAAGTDAGMTSHHAVMVVGGVSTGDKVGIIGLGGLGQIGARVAVLAGAEVYVAEINEEVWPLAESLGATATARSIGEFADVGLDVIVDFAGFGTTTAEAIETVRLGGRVVQVGMGRLEATISTKAMILGKVTLAGSNGGTKEDVAAIYEHLANGDIAPEITSIGFDDIPEGLAKLDRGEVVGRLVAEFGG